ncbi:MAG: hypothetical protein ACR2NP_16190 [Pirellulaceae bacterium]
MIPAKPKFAHIWLTLTLVTIGVPAASGQPASSRINWPRVEAEGLQVTRGDHLTLITDVRERADVDEFVTVFDQAVEGWCDYFAIPRASAEDWHMTGCLILDPQKFTDAGLLFDDLPAFPAGYQRNDMMWLFVQDGDYYTRHLLLHEGTHAFMEKFLGGYGPPWYAEGMAELLAVHRWSDGQLVINHRIGHRDEVPYWGRVKLIREDRDNDRGFDLDEVLMIPPDSFQQVRYYGWAWAACEFFDRHLQYQEVFRRLPSLVNVDPLEFNQQFRRELESDWETARQDWQNMVQEMDYGYDVERASLSTVADRSSSDDATEFGLASDRGWQDTGIEVRGGMQLEISGNGMYRVRDEGGTAWPADAGGITIEYYQGRPLGRLTAAVLPSESNDPLNVIDIGTATTIAIPADGRLLMRINESPADLHDNEGQLQVRVKSVSD